MAVSISNLSTKFANSSFTYNAISMNVTTGLYEANSKILTLKANGVVKFSVDVSGDANATRHLNAGVPLGHELLTTLSATGVATQTPTGLTLTGYRMLLFVYDDISHSDGANNRAPTINGQVFGSNRSAASLFYGMVFVTLSNGRGWGCVETDDGNNSTLRNLSLTNANTSFTVGWNGAGNFDGGSIEVYGVR